MPRTPEMRGNTDAKQEGSSLDGLRRDVSATREVFAKQKAHDAIARKSEKGSKAKEPSSFSSSERTEYEEKLREYRKAVLEASKSETDPKKKAALLREALINTTVKEADELWTAQRRAKTEIKGGSGAWEKISKIANRTVEGYRHLSWKQKLAISGALLVGANTGIPLVMGGAAAGIAAQRILSAGSAAMGIDALVKRFGIDRSRINEILGKDIRKEKDPIVLAEKLSALLEDENNGLNAQIFGIEGRKTKEVVLRGAASAVIFGSVVLGLPAKAIGKGVEHVAGDQIKAARSIAGRAVHKMMGFFVGSAEANVPPGGVGTTGALSAEEQLALKRAQAGVRNRMALNEGYGGAEDQVSRAKVGAGTRLSPNPTSRSIEHLSGAKTDRLTFRFEKGANLESTLNEYLKEHAQDIKANPELQKALGWDGDSKTLGAASRRIWLSTIEDVRANPNAARYEKFIDQLEQSGYHVKDAIKDTSHPEKLIKILDNAARHIPEGTELALPRFGAPVQKLMEEGSRVTPDRIALRLSQGESVEGTLNQYLKAHVENIKANPQLQKALGWDGDPKTMGRASHRLWLKMVDDVRAHPDTIAHKKIIEQLEQAGFHVKEVMKDTQHPERLTKLFDAVARRMPIGMEFTVNPQTGAMDFSDPRFGKVAGGIHETQGTAGKKINHAPVRGHASRLQEMLDEKHWQETDQSMARLKQNIDELKQSTQDAVDRAADEQEIRHLEKRAELSAQGDIEQAALALKRSDSQLQKIGLVARERSAWLADKTTRVQDVLRQIPVDYDLGRGGAGIDINLPHQEEHRWGAIPRQIKLAKHLREAMERAHLRFDEAGIPRNTAVRNMSIGQFLSNVNPQTGVFESPR